LLELRTERYFFKKGIGTTVKKKKNGIGFSIFLNFIFLFIYFFNQKERCGA